MRDLAAELARLKAQHQYRTRSILDGPQGAEIMVDGKPCLSFCSNDYLGLANHPALVAALAEGARRHGAGSGASHLVSGHHRAHHTLEEELAVFTGRPRALLFSTGYMANLGVISALMERGDIIFEDRLNHASLLDGGMLSPARMFRYPHRDMPALEQRLSAVHGRQCLIASDGVFSMDGDLAPLPELAQLAQRHQVWLMIDDAHGMGVLGQNGAGTLEHFGVDSTAVPILIGTLGKALGTFGAFVAGSADLIEYLIQRARTYIYTTALPPAIAHATSTSLRLLREESWRRDHLHRLIRRFRNAAAQLGWTLPDVHTPIQPLIVGEAEHALRLSNALLERGILVKAIRPPTVPQGTARLRITLSAAHSEAQVDRLIDSLESVL